MTNYSVKLYARAVRDLDGIYAYIFNELLSPDAAENTVNAIESAILSLEFAPERGSQRKTGAYAYKGYRQLFVGNYVIIYKVLHIRNEVHVITVRYVHSQF